MPEESLNNQPENNSDEALAIEYPAIKEKTILIVEDDRFLHSLIGDKLSKAGAKTLSAFDGEDGLAKAKESKPDIVLLDILLPGIDGFEVLKQLKADPALKNVPVIILSNLGQEEDIKKGTEFGAEEFLIKANFTLEDILKKINSVLQGSASQSEKPAQ